MHRKPHAHRCLCVVNDDEPVLRRGYDRVLEKKAPREPVSQCHHNGTGAQGREAVVPVTEALSAKTLDTPVE